MCSPAVATERIREGKAKETAWPQGYQSSFHLFPQGIFTLEYHSVGTNHKAYKMAWASVNLR